jgi:hypothetical protein
MNVRHGWSASPIGWDRTRNGRSPDECSLRRCNSLKLVGSEQVPRRVRKKSLYLRDSSDLNRSGQQLIVHVLDEWADTTAMGVFAVRTGPALFAPTGQAASFVGQRPLVHDAGFPGDVPVWRLMAAGRNESVLRIPRQQTSLVRYAEDK